MVDIQTDNIFKIGKVISTRDEYCGFRIKVRIPGEDDSRSDKELPYAFPLLPKMMHIVPKVDEAVLIVSTRMNAPYGQRFYIGPIIHQPEFMSFDKYDNGALTLLNGASEKNLLPSIKNKPDAEGALPTKDEISFLGRGDSDLTLSEKEVKLRCGVRITDPNDERNVLFNKTSPSYILLKQHGENSEALTTSSATIVSDEINLISTNGKVNFSLKEPHDLITDETMSEIITRAHVLPFGDVLVEFLKIFKTAFKQHTHPYAAMTPVKDGTYLALDNFDMNTILSENVRIN